MSKRTIKNNSKSKEFKKGGEKLEWCINPNVDPFKMFMDKIKDTLEAGEDVVREKVSRLDEDDEKEGNAVVDNPALKETAKVFNDAMLDELQDRLERQARIYNRLVETLLGELSRLRGRIKELEDSLLEKDEVLNDVIEELAAKERQLSAVRGVIDFDINIKRGEL